MQKVSSQMISAFRKTGQKESICGVRAWTFLVGSSNSLCYLLIAQQFQMCHCHGMLDAFSEKSMHNPFMIFLRSNQSSQSIVPYAVRLPLAFFLGVSAMVRPAENEISAIAP